MGNFKFRAGVPKDDMIMGLLYPATFMVPILVILLVAEILFPKFNLTHLATINIYAELAVLIPGFIIGGFFASKLKKKCGHDFEVYVYDKTITVYMDGKIVFDDQKRNISFKEQSNMIKLIIKGIDSKVVFIGRNNRNLFGFSDDYDLLEIRRLEKYLRKK